MPEELDLSERVELAIRVGESHFREFKSALDGLPERKAPRPIRDLLVDVARTLVGFANADGGELLIGVEDDGSISGVAHSPADIELLLKAPTSHVHAETPLPTPRTAVVQVEGRKIVYFAVPKGTRFVHLTIDGRCLRRVDRDTRSGFRVELHNRSLYDPEVKLWLSNFDRFDLDENQRAVVALGYGSKQFSTQDIIDRLGIVDTDKVRELVGDLRQHGILETTKNKNQVEQFKEQHHVPRRSVPKYRISENAPGDGTTSVSTALDDDFREKSFDLYIGNLPYEVPLSAVTDFLAEHGCDVLDVRIPQGPDQRNKGFAFATVVTKEGQDSTIVRLDGQGLGGRRIHVRPAQPRPSRAL
jgi:hypothetical protein